MFLLRLFCTVAILMSGVIHKEVTFQVLTATNMKITDFCCIGLCSLVESYLDRQ
jgi:hypothetical protein